MTLHPHLNFAGQCEEAFKFYEQCLGGKITFMMKFAGSPVADHVPHAWHDKILHATLTIGNEVLTGADVLPEQYQKPQGFAVLLGTRIADEAERVFQTLAEYGTVQMPLAETFWAVRFGMVTDRFGIPWMINCGKGQ